MSVKQFFADKAKTEENSILKEKKKGNKDNSEFSNMYKE